MRVRISYRDRAIHSTEMDAERLLWDEQLLRVDRRDGKPFVADTDKVRSVSRIDGAGDVDNDAESGAADVEGLAELRDAIPQTR